jgi:hypothetical protein
MLTGEKGSPVLRAMVNSLRAIPTALQATVIISYVVCQFENYIMLPKWWESLPPETKLKIVNAAEGRYFRRELPKTCDWQLTEMPVHN